MARAPIIISNGGVAGVLSKGLHTCDNDADAEKMLIDNLSKMKEKTVIHIIKTKQNREAHCLYWRLSEEAKYEDAVDEKAEKKYTDGKEAVSINTLLDPY
jgi:hypothetical protein